MHDGTAIEVRFTTGRRRARGRALPDLAAVLAVAALLAGVAAPTVLASWHARRGASEAQAFIEDLAYAQAEAARRGQRVGVCAGTGPGCGSRNGWDQGRTVWLDLDGNGRPDAGEPVLREAAGWATGDSLFSTRGSARIAFTADGRMQGLPGDFATWTLRTQGQETVRCIRVNNAGRTLLQVRQGSCA